MSQNSFDLLAKATYRITRLYKKDGHSEGAIAKLDNFSNLVYTATLVLGFYSLSPASVEFSRTPDVVTRGRAQHDVPVFRLSRLGVDKSLQRKGLGGQLLLSAGRRCLRASQEVGGRGIAD